VAFGTFRSVKTTAGIVQPGIPGDVWWVSDTGLLWFISGDGSAIQLLASVPVPTIGPTGLQGPAGPAGPTGPIFPNIFEYSGSWSPSPTSYIQGSVVSYAGYYYVSLATLTIADNTEPPVSNHWWSLLAPVFSGTQKSELITAIDGAGQNPTAGFHAFIPAPYNCVLTGWTLLGDQSGSAQLDIKWSTFANLPSTVSIVAGSGPTLVNQQKASGSVSGWSPIAFNAGDVIEVDVISASGALTFLTLSLQIQATN
jgi:hypothetical protein